MGYKGMMNMHAYNVLEKLPDIPDCKLMVGSAEQLAPLPVIFYKKAIPPQATPLMDNVKNMSYEDMVEGLHSGALSINDFPTTAMYFGEPVEIF